MNCGSLVIVVLRMSLTVPSFVLVLVRGGVDVLLVLLCTCLEFIGGSFRLASVFAAW